MKNNNNYSIRIFNIIGFQLGWFACVSLTNSEYYFAGPLMMLVYVIIYSKWIKINLNEIKFIIIVTIIGTIFDSILMNSGVINYENGNQAVSFLAPLWISSLWLGFSTTLNNSLSWMKENILYSILGGAVFGPLAFWGCQELGSISLNYSPVISMLIISVVWGMIMPLLFLISDKLQVKTH